MHKKYFSLFMVLFFFLLNGCGSSSSTPTTSMGTLSTYIENGDTADGTDDRVIIVDTRSSSEYIEGHIKDAVNVPLSMVAEDGKPLYTNGYDEISTTASEEPADSWFAHMLINQLVNDFATTYQDSTIIFYGAGADTALDMAETIGYTDISRLSHRYEDWAADYPELTEMYAPGVTMVDSEEKTIEFTGFINLVNYEAVSSNATHHAIVYKGGGLNYYSLMQADIPPFCFQELLTYLGASPDGNMADGIYYGDAEEYGSKHNDGQRIDISVTWDGSDHYYSIEELFDEMPSEYHPDPDSFSPLGIEPRIGGTRDSNMNWNPGCIFCLYSCVCGISSNAEANDNVWFADGGIYDTIGLPDDPRNYYAGRYFPKADLLPGPGEEIRIRVTIVDDTAVQTVTKSDLHTYVQNGETAENSTNRILIVDTRSSQKYIEGHIKDAINAPYYMVHEEGLPLYTNNWDEVSTTASDQISDSWLAHLLVNQLVNDFVTTYQDSQIIFYGDDSYTVEKVAESIGYSNVSILEDVYESWATDYPDLTQMYAPGVVEVDEEVRTFTFTGFINDTNYDNVSTRPTHHGVTYKGGALSFYSFLEADIPPLCFHELLVYLGANPEGNMADGIYYGTDEEYAGKYPDGARIDFSVTWTGAGQYYPIQDLFEEKPSEFHPDPDNFTTLGIEPRLGGTRDSNLLWNPGCIFCMYSCVCGISSNAKANENTWFADGGIYDTMGQPDNPRNYYAGRYFPRSAMMPGAGTPIQIKVTVVE